MPIQSQLGNAAPRNPNAMIPRPGFFNLVARFVGRDERVAAFKTALKKWDFPGIAASLKGASRDEYSRAIETSYHLAAARGDSSKVTALIKHGAPVSLDGKFDALCATAYDHANGHFVLRTLLNSTLNGKTPIPRRQHDSPLMHALCEGNASCAQLLLARGFPLVNGSQVSVSSGIDHVSRKKRVVSFIAQNYTPLHAVVMNKNPMTPRVFETLKVLTQFALPCGIDQADSNGLRPLDYAFIFGHPAAVPTLAANGGGLRRKAPNGNSVLDNLAIYGSDALDDTAYEALMTVLAKHDASVGGTDIDRAIEKAQAAGNDKTAAGIARGWASVRHEREASQAARVEMSPRKLR